MRTVNRVLYQPFLQGMACGGQIWRYVPEHRRPRHFHAEPELNLVVTGRARFAIGDSLFLLGPGDLLSFPPGQDHALVNATPDLELFSFGVTAEFSTDALGRDAARLVTAPLRVRLKPDQLNQLGERCMYAWHTSGAAAMANQVADLWQRAHQVRTGKPDFHVVTRRILEEVSRNPELSRERLARLLRTSPSEASRRFHRDLGVTIAAYRTRIRLLRFVRLVDSGYDQSQAAESAGFGSYSQCHRTFRETFGCSPRSFFHTDVRSAIQGAYDPLVFATSSDAYDSFA
jgi:AraC-like DNA-binding protein/quercetin dioxygenase-like cupin family protein